VLQGERIDKEIFGGAGADANENSVWHVLQCGLRCVLLALVRV
jgi:hypothetical protein